jgi:ribosomal protein L4
MLIVLLLLVAPQEALPPPVEPYKTISLSEPDVRAAMKVALSAANRKGKLISAERHTISADNIRLCITMNRSSSSEFARVVLSRNPAKKSWEVMLWSWGSCGR